MEGQQVTKEGDQQASWRVAPFHWNRKHVLIRNGSERRRVPSNWVSSPQPNPTPAIEGDATSSRYSHDAEPEEIVEAEIVEPGGEPADTPPRIAEMIKSRAFDRKTGSDRGGVSASGR